MVCLSQSIKLVSEKICFIYFKNIVTKNFENKLELGVKQKFKIFIFKNPTVTTFIKSFILIKNYKFLIISKQNKLILLRVQGDQRFFESKLIKLVLFEIIMYESPCKEYKKKTINFSDIAVFVKSFVYKLMDSRFFVP